MLVGLVCRSLIAAAPDVTLMRMYLRSAASCTSSLPSSVDAATPVGVSRRSQVNLALMFVLVVVVGSVVVKSHVRCKLALPLFEVSVFAVEGWGLQPVLV